MTFISQLSVKQPGWKSAFPDLRPWFWTEKRWSPPSGSGMSLCLRWGAGLSLRDRGRSSTIRGELEVEPLLLHIERSQLRWFIWLWCLLGGGPGSEPEVTGGIIYPIWPGNTSGSPRRSWSPGQMWAVNNWRHGPYLDQTLWVHLINSHWDEMA